MTQYAPTPAEIETLREAVDGCGGPSYTQAIAILDRLSPAPAPEVDEATRIAREFVAVGWASTNEDVAASFRRGERDCDPNFIDALTYLRQVLSELIASKDAEIAEWKSQERVAFERQQKAESELAALRAENERLKADNMPPEGYKNLYIAARDCIFDANKLGRIEDGWLLLETVNVSVTPKAAERNTAEPATITPQVEKTARALLRSIATIKNHEMKYATILPIISDEIDEAEARGRREALEGVLRWLRSPDGKGSDAGIDYADDFADQIERLMTEVK